MDDPCLFWFGHLVVLYILFIEINATLSNKKSQWFNAGLSVKAVYTFFKGFFCVCVFF